jgi:hypothetical protein
MLRPVGPYSGIDPELAGVVVRDDDLSLAGKLTLIYVLSQPYDLVFSRADLVYFSPYVAAHLHEVLHELVRRRWMTAAPAEAPPCQAASFRLYLGAGGPVMARTGARNGARPLPPPPDCEPRPSDRPA